MTTSKPASAVDLYGPSYRFLATALYADIRRDAFGEDLGQTGWITAPEQDLFITWLGLSPSSRLLDLACGSGRPSLRIAQKTGCRVCGIDLNPDGIEQAQASAQELGLGERAEFRAGDATTRLPFADASFDAVMCIDAINHLPDRPRLFEEWRRVLKPGGRLLITDPTVVTGAVTNEEIAIRASIGFFVFVPAGLDEAVLGQVGFEVERVEDRTQNMADNASGWRAARAKREAELRAIEGDATFEGQQRFLGTAATLARERRLSRFALLARRRP
jgi:SAM-dependent methyltransferase